MLFLGEYYVSFSGQGRLVVPKKIREALGKTEQFMLSKGYNKCLAGYRLEDWKKATTNLTGIPAMDNTQVDLKRHLFSSATGQEIDGQGRAVIPQNLLTYADLKGKTAVIIGVGDHFEVWEPKNWKKYLETIDEKINKS